MQKKFFRKIDKNHYINTIEKYYKNDSSLDLTKILEDLNVMYSFSVNSIEISKIDINKNKHSLPRFDCNKFKYGGSAPKI